MESLYREAYACYETGHFEKAKKIFAELVSKEPMEKAFWMGLAASSQMQKDYSESVYAWSFVQLLDPENPLPYVHAAECFLSLKQKEEAKDSLLVAQEKAEGNPSLLSKIDLLLKAGVHDANSTH
jgi:type III secretion system low calcium response chaperone LcrH/SycD